MFGTSRISRWIYAAKVASWPKLLVPFVLGQAVGAFDAGRLGFVALGFGFVFSLSILLYVVFLNDWADARVDGIKRELFPDGCSPKTLPDRILSPRWVVFAGVAAGTLGIGIAYGASFWLMRPWLFAACVIGLALFWAYSLPPLRLNYRGGGELLEAIGVGFVLPAINAYAQSGDLRSPSYLIFVPFTILAASSAIASGLADEQSDVAGGKVTFVTTFGNPAARSAVNLLIALGGLFWVVVPLTADARIFPASVVASCATLVFAPRVWARSKDARTNAFPAMARYKLELHRAIWFGAIAFSFCLWAYVFNRYA